VPEDTINFKRVDAGQDIIENKDIFEFLKAAVDIERQCQNSSKNAPNQTAIDFEVQMYLSDVKNFTECDALKFWSTKLSSMPLLSTVAFTILSVPATSAPVERVFSRASIVLDKRRHNLSDEKLEREVFFGFNAGLD